MQWVLMSASKKLLFLAASLVLLLSCNKGGGGEEAAIAFSQNPMFVTSESAVHDCGLICNASWTASTKDAWVTVLTESGNSGDPLKIRVSSNTGETDRNASIKVVAGKTGKVLQLVQYANAASGFVSETKVNLDTYGKATYISVNTEDGWNYTTPEDADWLKLEKRSATALGISADVNFTGDPRSATFKVRSDDGTKEAEITVTQQFSNEKFKASTVYGRKLVYAMGEYIKTVSKDSFTELTPGVTSFEMSATLQDEFGGDTGPKQRNMFLFEVDMTQATIVATLKADNDANIHTTQKMTEQLKALQQSRTGITVWGGTNGDFFYTTGDGSTCNLQGVLYRRGVCLNDSFNDAVCTVFAVFKDGTAHVMSQAEYATVKQDIREAVGGRQVLLTDGNKAGFSDPAQHPRTAVGASRDGKTVWMLVVDGRDEQYGTGSFSVSYDVLARILKAAGAYDAINLDGGGSSTYVTRSSGGTLTRRNQPANSNRVERTVLDGLAIVK